MANEEQIARLKQGVGSWNKWRHENALIEPDLTGADLYGANLTAADLREVHLTGADLTGANLTWAHLTEADLREAHLTGADLTGAHLDMADLRAANLTGAHLFEANLTGADLTRAHLIMAHLTRAYLIMANLTGAHLFEANLTGADLTGAHLDMADLTGAHLFEANLTGADLTGAHLDMADLTGADLTGAILTGAILTGAILTGANLTRAGLTGAHLTRARFYETILGDTDLTNTRGLDSCEHKGPSTIDHRTIMRSWPLPLAFLRGCGLPDTLIDYLPALVNEPLEFSSCFISYSSKDEEFAHHLHADLQNKSVRCWFAPHDSQGGKKTHEQIDQAIRVYDKLLLVLSEASINSGWVEFEIRKARKREVAEKRRMLFPIRLMNHEMLAQWECFDADTKKDLAVEIREYSIPDFSMWKDHDPYQQAFTRLLRDLKAETQEEQRKFPGEK